MDKHIRNSSILFILIIGIVAFGVTTPTYSTNTYTVASHQVQEPEIADGTAIKYSELSDDDKDLFRKQIASAEVSQSLMSVDAGDYVQLDGRYYAIETVNQLRMMDTALVYVSFLSASILIPIAAFSILLSFNLTKKQFITIVACMSLMLVGITIVGVQPPKIERTVVGDTPVSEVPDEAFVAEADKYSDSEYQRLLQSFAGKDTSTTDYSDFIDSEVDYIKSDGEYYPVQEKNSVPDLWRISLLILLLVEGFVSVAMSLDYLVEAKWGTNGEFIEFTDDDIEN